MFDHQIDIRRNVQRELRHQHLRFYNIETASSPGTQKTRHSN